jgi:hypothetical protein
MCYISLPSVLLTFFTTQEVGKLVAVIGDEVGSMDTMNRRHGMQVEI